MSNKLPTEPTGPEAKCCLGVTYFNRTLERTGSAPVRMSSQAENEWRLDAVWLAHVMRVMCRSAWVYLSLSKVTRTMMK